MNGQLNIFHGSGLDSPPNSRHPQKPVEKRATPQETPPPTASSPEQHDHAGQLGDDGSLHFMLTGQPNTLGVSKARQ